MKRWNILGFGLWLAWCGVLPALQADENNLITAGSLVGQVAIAMPESVVLQRLGKPSPHKHGSRDVSIWSSKPSGGGPAEHIAVMFRDSDSGRLRTVSQIAVTSPFFHTYDGNSTRSDLSAIWHEYPDLRYLDSTTTEAGAKMELYDSTTLGISFLIERTPSPARGESWGKCRVILVHLAGEQPYTVGLDTLAE